MLRVPCLDRQHPKWVPVAAAPGRWGGRGRSRLHHMVALIMMVKVLRDNCSCLVL